MTKLLLWIALLFLLFLAPVCGQTTTPTYWLNAGVWVPCERVYPYILFNSPGDGKLYYLAADWSIHQPTPELEGRFDPDPFGLPGVIARIDKFGMAIPQGPGFPKYPKDAPDSIYPSVEFSSNVQLTATWRAGEKVWAVTFAHYCGGHAITFTGDATATPQATATHMPGRSLTRTPTPAGRTYVHIDYPSLATQEAAQQAAAAAHLAEQRASRPTPSARPETFTWKHVAVIAIVCATILAALRMLE